MGGRQLASKWLKTKTLLEHPEIAPHIPHSELYSAATLRTMTEQYGTVVLKPVRGTGGSGVMKISRSEEGYIWSYRTRKRTYSDFDRLVRAVNKITGRRRYLIQRGIDLAEVHGRPIDYRVKFVKQDGRWTFRAIVGRIARKGLFVTNLCRGGRLVSAREGISRSLSPGMVAAKKREMRDLTKTSTRLLERRFPGIRQLGYDYGIDRSGQIWMLEVNTRPH